MRARRSRRSATSWTPGKRRCRSTPSCSKARPGTFADLCSSLTRAPTLQHDDLHESNVYGRGGRLTFLDWGDTCVAHPFATMYVTFRWPARFRGEEAVARVRAAYLGCWEADAEDELERVLPVAAFARLLQWERIGEAEAVARNLEWFLENVARS